MPRFPFDTRAFGSTPAGPRAQTQAEPTQFRSLNATLLFCPTCKEATPARERLLLVLPTGNKYEYLCSYCGTSTGEKTDQEEQETRLFLP